MIFNKLKEENRSKPTYSEVSSRFSWKSLTTNNLEDTNYLKESTYFKCITYTANKIASLSFDIEIADDKKGKVEAVNHEAYQRLKLRPNNSMNVVNMMKSLVTIGEHEGISCLYIDKYDMSLYPCRVNKIYVDDKGIIECLKSTPVALEIVCNNITRIVSEESCIMYNAGVTTDGINSEGIKDYLKLTLKTTMEGQNILSELFANGLTNKALVQLTSDIKDEKELSKIQKKFNRLFSSEGRIFTVPAGYNVSPLNLSLADSQFKELRGLSRREIASNYGLTPSMIGEETSGTIDIEGENIRYLTDVLLVKIKSLEQEFNYKYLSEIDRKLGISISINFNVLLRTTAEKQKDIIIDYVRYGVYSLEYARQLLGVPIDNEGTVTLPSGQILLKDLLEGRATWQKNNSTNKPTKGGEEN